MDKRGWGGAGRRKAQATQCRGDGETDTCQLRQIGSVELKYCYLSMPSSTPSSRLEELVLESKARKQPSADEEIFRFSLLLSALGSALIWFLLAVKFDGFYSCKYVSGDGSGVD
ncbi:hypothetical protein ACLOJK_005832 [Asimina triloba]